MKAAFLVRNGESQKAFKIIETNQPVPKVNEILIRVETFGLNYADVMARNGIYPAAPPLPSILGYEVIGVVEDPNGSEIFKKGDRVIAFTRFGAYAEYCVANQHATQVLPAEIPNGEATALATQYCTGLYMANWMSNIQPHERVLIHAAAGGVGHALIQIAQKKGCEIIATAGSQEKIDYLKSMGLKTVINYNQSNFQLEIEKMFGKKAIDVAFDPIGGKNFKMNDQLMGPGGRLLLFGISSFSKKKGTLIDRLVLGSQFGLMSPLNFLIRSYGIIGVNMLHVANKHPEIIGKLLTEAISGYQKGIFQPKMAYDGRVENISEAHFMLESRNTIGKLALSW